MRELETILDECFVTGLQPQPVMPNRKSHKFLINALGFRIGQYCIEGAENITNPIPSTVDMHYNWPFPQFLTQDKYKILVVRDNIRLEDIVYSLSDDYSVVTEIFAIDQLTFGQGTLMELADFGSYAFMTNGVIMLYWDPTLAIWDKKISLPTVPMMRTVCNFRGQLIGGCVVSDWHDCDETSIVWSKIGDVDFTPDRRNESGFRRDLFGGEVYHVKRLGKDIIIYSSRGISRMFPVGSPAATFGFEELLNFGIISRGSVAGDNDEHLFVDESSRIWRHSRGGFKKLDYRGQMNQLSSDDIIVNHNPNQGDFYITDGNKGFLISPNGMTEVPDCASALWYDGELYSIPESPDKSTYSPLIVSGTIDFGYRGLKTIFSIEAGLDNMSGVTIAIDWRVDKSESFQRTNFVSLNNEGIASIIASGIEFRFCIKFDSFIYDEDTLDYMKIRWKMTDLRGMRGIYAPPPRGQ
jgi:hypothetical protein